MLKYYQYLLDLKFFFTFTQSKARCVRFRLRDNSILTTMKSIVKAIIFCSFVFVSNFSIYGQSKQSAQKIQIHNPNSDVEISELTRTRLIKNDGYSDEEIATLKASNPKRLAYLDYYYSKSFRVKAGQNYTSEQFLLINISKLYQYRLDSSTKEIYDPESHLYLILDSKNTVKATNEQIMYPSGKPASAKKFK